MVVQRESFNLVFTIAEWGRGAASARDVQIARALLGQRLSVVTRGGNSTFENAGPRYGEALRDLDGFILQLGSFEEPGRALDEARPILQSFLTETRALSETFQAPGAPADRDDLR
jgi:hypothetical protein